MQMKNAVIITSAAIFFALAVMLVPLQVQNHVNNAAAQESTSTMSGTNQMMGSNSLEATEENYATMQNTPLSKSSDGITLSFNAQKTIRANDLASVNMTVSDEKSGAKLSHVDWAIVAKDPDGNVIYKTTTGHTHVGNMDFKLAFQTAGENTVALTTSSIGKMMMEMEVEPKGRTHTMLSGSPKGFATDPENDFGSRSFEFPVYVQSIDQKHTLQGTEAGTSINVKMSTTAPKIVSGTPVTFVFTVTKAADDSMITHPDMQVTAKVGNYISTQSAPVEGKMTMKGAVHGHTGIMTLTEVFPSAGHYVLDVELQPSPLSNYSWGSADTRFEVFVSEPSRGTTMTSQTDTVPAANTVNIIGLEAPFFTPNVMNIQAGTTITFVNTDGNSHTVTSVKQGTMDPDGIFDSGIIKTGKSFSYKFDKPGIYEYICNIHTHMRGTINVS
jgi:plastocyanin